MEFRVLGKPFVDGARSTIMPESMRSSGGIPRTSNQSNLAAIEG
jgi:hypothetical protein